MAVARPSELELQVLGVLWDRGPSSVRAVLEAMPDGKDRAYTTILSVMQTLEKKGLVRHTQQGPANIYHSKARRDQVVEPLMKDLLRNAFGGNPAQGAAMPSGWGRTAGRRPRGNPSRDRRCRARKRAQGRECDEPAGCLLEPGLARPGRHPVAYDLARGFTRLADRIHPEKDSRTPLRRAIRVGTRRAIQHSAGGAVDVVDPGIRGRTTASAGGIGGPGRGRGTTSGDDITRQPGGGDEGRHGGSYPRISAMGLR